jgi:hypothetical protein
MEAETFFNTIGGYFLVRTQKTVKLVDIKPMPSGSTKYGVQTTDNVWASTFDPAVGEALRTINPGMVIEIETQRNPKGYTNLMFVSASVAGAPLGLPGTVNAQPGVQPVAAPAPSFEFELRGLRVSAWRYAQEFVSRKEDVPLTIPNIAAVADELMMYFNEGVVNGQ